MVLARAMVLARVMVLDCVMVLPRVMMLACVMVLANVILTPFDHLTTFTFVQPSDCFHHETSLTYCLKPEIEKMGIQKLKNTHFGTRVPKCTVTKNYRDPQALI